MSDYTDINQTTEYTPQTMRQDDIHLQSHPPTWWQLAKESCSKTVAIGSFFGFFIGLLFGGLYLHQNNCPDPTPTTTPPPHLRGNNTLLLGNGPPCNAHGKWYNNTCYCDDGYVGVECDYKQSTQTIAFCLEFFLGPFGAGYFYMGLNGLGIAQLMTTLSPLVLLALTGCLCNNQLNCDSSGYACMDLVWRLTIFVFWLTSIILIGQNKLNDGNDKPLESW